MLRKFRFRIDFFFGLCTQTLLPVVSHPTSPPVGLPCRPLRSRPPRGQRSQGCGARGFSRVGRGCRVRAAGQDGQPRRGRRGAPGQRRAGPSPASEAVKSGATPSRWVPGQGVGEGSRPPAGGGGEGGGKTGKGQGWKGNSLGEAGGFLNASPAAGEGRGERLPPTSDPTHRFPPKLRELTQDDRREDEQLSPPGSRLGPHGDQDPDATRPLQPRRESEIPPQPPAD